MSGKCFSLAAILLLAPGTLPVLADEGEWPAEVDLASRLTVEKLTKGASFLLAYTKSSGLAENGKGQRVMFRYEDSSGRKLLSEWVVPASPSPDLFPDSPLAGQFFLRKLLTRKMPAPALARAHTERIAVVERRYPDGTTTLHEISKGSRAGMVFRDHEVTLGVRLPEGMKTVQLTSDRPTPLPLGDHQSKWSVSLKKFGREGTLIFECSNGSVTWDLSLPAPAE